MKRYIVWLTVNHNCNLDCKCCYQRQSLNRKQEMPFEMAREIIGMADELDVQKMIIIGGEPTVHNNFFDILTCSHKIEFTLVTNSIAFANNDFCKRADDAGLSRVTTSLKGASDDEYEFWTGRRMFSQVMRAIENLEKSAMDHQVSVTVCRPVVENWKNLLQVLKNSGASHFTFSFERPVFTRSTVEFDDYMMPSRAAKFIEEEMYHSLLDSGLSFDLNLTFPQCLFFPGFLEKMITDGHAVAGCQLLMNTGIIFNPEGKVIPCNHMIFNSLGEYGKDFKNASELKMWRESKVVQDFYDVACSSPAEQCDSCKVWPSCGAGCRMFWLYQGADKLLPFKLS